MRRRVTIRCWGCEEPACALVLLELPNVGLSWWPFCEKDARHAVLTARTLKLIRR